MNRIKAISIYPFDPGSESFTAPIGGSLVMAVVSITTISAILLLVLLLLLLILSSRTSVVVVHAVPTVPADKTATASSELTLRVILHGVFLTWLRGVSRR